MLWLSAPAIQCRNSEIYNHEDVQQQYLPGVSMVRESKSDSAKPGHLYQKYGDDDKIWNALDGTFACVIYDERTGEFCAARDPIGICPMYWGKDANGATWFASEMKALQHQCVSFEIFPPVSSCILPLPIAYFLVITCMQHDHSTGMSSLVLVRAPLLSHTPLG